MSNNLVELLKGVVGELKEIARTETVIGEPVTVGKKTVIPVVKISVGFGAGGGQGEGEKNTSNFGGGGGGGTKIEPAAFIIIDDKEVSLLPMAKGKWENIIDAIPGLAKKISKLRDKLKKEKEEESEKDSSVEEEASEKSSDKD